MTHHLRPPRSAEEKKVAQSIAYFIGNRRRVMTASARDIAMMLGKARREGRGWRCLCPLHGGCSLILRDGAQALLVKCWSGCATDDLLAELRSLGLIEARSQASRPRSPSPSRHDNDDDYARRQHDKAAWLWSQRRPIKGTIAEKYLRRARGITCALPPTLAFLPSRKPEHHPAMISAFTLPEEIEPGVLGMPSNVQSVHLTLLRQDGTGKADTETQKLVIGSPANLPIMLAPPNDLLGLAITEGIEDGLTAHQATGLGVWAAGSAVRMPALIEMLPSYIEAVTIYSHPDEAGRAGAYGLAEALDQHGIEVFMEGLR